MRILAITAYYPPYHFGGYEIRVKNILDELSILGHSIKVLTNRPEIKTVKKNKANNYPVMHKLHNRTNARFFPKELVVDFLDTRLIEDQINTFQPDVIYLGHTYILSKVILPLLARLNIPIIYDEGGISSIEAWTNHGRWFHFCGDYHSRCALLNWMKPKMISIVVALSRGRIKEKWVWPEKIRIIFNSELNRRNAQRAGVPIANSTVIHSGVDTDLFTFKLREKFDIPLRIIVPGRIERRKGQLDAVHLVQQLIEAGIDTHLILAGSDWVDGYAQEVNATIKNGNLQEKISILPMLTHEELVKLYHQSDICFFPSFQQAGLSRVPLEAMACGCIVISYGNEGSDEIIRDPSNGFIVKEGDINSVRDLVIQLSKNPDLVREITTSARTLIDENFNMDRYIDQIESVITGINTQ